MGAFDQPIPWSIKGARGCRRFLDRVWRLQEMLDDKAKGISKDLEININSTIKKVSEDYERMKFNTAIAAMMSLVNDLYLKGSVTRDELKALLLLLSPVAPHICEEMWQTQGFGSPLYAQPWPAYDENKLVADEVEIALQINGKVRGRLMVPSTMTREEGEKTLPQNPEVIRFTEGKSIMKIIFVPGRLLNLVVK